MVKMNRDSWMGQLIRNYKRFLSPLYSSEELDEANKIITDADDKLLRLIRKHKGKE